MQETIPINDAINLIINNCYLQTYEIDVAIPYLIGAPGAGKTAIINDTIMKYGGGILSTHFALKPIEETGGIPQFERIIVNEKDILGTIWSFPDIMVQLYKLSEKYSENIVLWLLDDAHLNTPMHNALLYELLTERKLREYKLPKNVAILMAGNHASSKAGAKTMFSAIVNRVCFFPCHADYKHWKMNFAIPNGVHHSILNFLNHDQYRKFFHEDEQVDSPWASPRSWTRLSNWLNYIEFTENKIPEFIDVLRISNGHISSEAATNYVTYYEIYSKINIEEIFNNVDLFEVPSSAIDGYINASAIISWFVSKNNKSLISKLSKIIYKFLKDQKDIGIMMIKELLSYDKSLNKKNFIGFAIEIDKIEKNILDNIIGDIKDV